MITEKAHAKINLSLDVCSRRPDGYHEVSMIMQTIELHDETVADDVDGWDSFEHINLIVGIEDEFGFKIPMGKVVSMKNVGEMVDIILEMGK